MSSARSDIEGRARADAAPNGAGRDFLGGTIKMLLLAELGCAGRRYSIVDR